MKLAHLSEEFFSSEKSGSIILILCTAVSLFISNSIFQNQYLEIWNFEIFGKSTLHWINEGLMSIFFLLIGLELEREIYSGELSNFKNASLPVLAALGGMLVPAGIFLLFNFGKPTQIGAGIPMATDIAFAIGILSLLGKRVPLSLKIMLTALAVIDDLGAILVIAIFYTNSLILVNLGIATGIFICLLILNRLKVYSLIPYLAGGALMWYFMSISGVHATISGVLLAFAIPFRKGNENSPSILLQHRLHFPVAFIILPLFALANTCVTLNMNCEQVVLSPGSLGIFAGLVIGKPLGIFLFAYIAVATGLCVLPADISWKQILGIGILGGIGFTMSIFIILLAYHDPGLIVQSKSTVLFSSLVSGLLGFLWLNKVLKKTTAE